jgi:hypothetical protein
MKTLRRLSACVPAAALAVSLLPTTACKPGKNVAGAIAKTPDGADALTGAQCSVKSSSKNPYTVNWEGMNRAALEGRAAKGLVPVRYSGCEIELLNGCKVEGQFYEYLGLTPRREAVTIHDFDELYAKIPIGAVKLEAKLERAGSLVIDMYIAGSHSAPMTDRYDEYDLKGIEAECKQATHVITGIQVGAFTFATGASAEIGGGASVEGVGGAGAKSGAQKERISSGGDFTACAASEPGSTEAPKSCNEILQIELVEIERVVASTPTTQPSSGGFGLSDNNKDTAGAPGGWTEADERKRKIWYGLFYTGLVGFVGGGVVTLVGYLMSSRATKDLASLEVDGSPGSVATTGADRQKAVRNYAAARPLLYGGLIGLAVGGILATISLSVAQKLKRRKDAAHARVGPTFSPGGIGAQVEVRF